MRAISPGYANTNVAALYAAASGGLLDGSESDGTNLLSPADFSTVGTVDFSITLNDAVAPDGTTTAARLLETAATARHIIYGPGVSIAAGSSHVWSIYVKSITRRYVQLSLFGSGPKVYAYYDLQTGSVTDSGVVSPSGGTAISSVMCEAAVNGFYKCSFTAILDGSSASPSMVVAGSDVATYGAPLDSDSPSYAGNTSNGLYVWRPKAV